jgi:hypothetical protein
MPGLALFVAWNLAATSAAALGIALAARLQPMITGPSYVENEVRTHRCQTSPNYRISPPLAGTTVKSG